MSTFPPVNQIAGQHYSIYETYYKQVNPSGTATIGAKEAASILKRSGLNDNTLRKIWNLADFNSRGFLDKQGFFVALKLVALAQSSKDVSVNSLAIDCAPPTLSEYPRPVVLPPPDAGIWIIKKAEKLKYDGIFDSLKPVNGYVTGDKVKPVLMNSKLSVDVLGRVWNMSDIDKDGLLDRDEFAVAMHLVYRALDGEQVPSVIAPGLIPPSKRHVTSTAAASSASSGGFPPNPTTSSFSQPSTSAAIPWVVTPSEKTKFDAMFLQADKDKDGLVSGAEVKNIFIASGLPQQVLAHIWELCDTKNAGLLNAEQFALAMHLISKKRMGIEPPNSLSPEMVPPSVREKDDISFLSSNLASLQAKDFAAIKELDHINQEIEKLGREKVTLQQDIEQTEETIRKRKTEIENLQSELSKNEKSVQELQVQKSETHEKLNSVEEQKAKYESMLSEIKQSYEEEKQAIESLKLQIATQESSLKGQEEDFAKARKELNELRDEESKLEHQLQSGQSQLEQIKKSLLATKNEINQARTKVSKLTEDNNSLNASINQYTSMTSSVSSNSASSTPAPIGDGLGALPENLEATFAHSDVDQTSARATAGSSPVSSISGFSVGSGSGRVDDANDEDFKDTDPFKPKSDIFSGNETENVDPFNLEDPFKQDPFKTVSFADDPFAGDPFHDKDPFHQEHAKHQNEDDPFGSDPFKPIAASTTHSSSSTIKATRPIESTADPFRSLDPFGSGAFSAPKTTKSSAVPDPFSSDPFAPVSSATADPVITASTASKDKAADLFAGESNGNAWSDPFGSSHSDPFSGGAAETMSDMNDPWSAFSEDTAQPKSQQIDWGKSTEGESSKKDMDVALTLQQTVESSSDA